MASWRHDVDVVIDPAHGGHLPLLGSLPGLRSGVRSGQLQKHILLDVARAMEQSLSARGHTAVLTRDGDRNLALSERVAMSARLGAKVFVGLHADGHRGGAAVMVHPQASRDSVQLARVAQGSVQSVRGTATSICAEPAEELQPAQHASRTATCRIDLGDLSQAADDLRLASPAYRAQLGYALGRAVADFLDNRPKIPQAAVGGPLDLWHQVPLVPQLTGMSCWAAAAAMVIGWRDRVPVEPAEVARASGRWQEYQVGLLPRDVDELARSWNLHPIRQPLDARSLAHWLELWGPVWMGEASPGLHSIVVVGLRGDGTADGTRVLVNDPWPLGRGERYHLTMRQLARHVGSAAAMTQGPAQLLTAGGRRPATRPISSDAVGYGSPISLMEAYRDAPVAGPPAAGSDRPVHTEQQQLAQWQQWCARPTVRAARAPDLGPVLSLLAVRGTGGEGCGFWADAHTVLTAAALGPRYRVRVGSTWVEPTETTERVPGVVALHGIPAGPALETGPAGRGARRPRSVVVPNLRHDGAWVDAVPVRAAFSDVVLPYAEHAHASLVGAPWMQVLQGHAHVIAVGVPDVGGVVGRRLS